MERDLVDGAAGVNRATLTRLLYDNYDIVFRYLIKFTMSKSLAEDLAQETMVRAIEKIGLYDSKKAKFSTWLITVARNIYIDSLRKKKHEQNYINGETAMEDLFKVPCDNREDWHSMLDALAALPDESRCPLVMKHYYGYSLEEIARIMSIPLGTVKSRIHNAIKNIRKELE